MDKLFIESRYKGNIDFNKIDFKSLPNKIGLFTTVQYMDFLEEAKKSLENKGKEVIIYDTNATYPGQILGCSTKRFKGTDALFYIGDGRFHPIALAIENEIPVFTFNPFNNKFSEITKEDTKKILQKINAGLAKFHTSKEIGILLSTKPGQYNPRLINRIKERFPEKNYYELAFDTLDFTQLENFPFIECFINTACPRISYDDFSKFPKPIAEAVKLLEIK